MDPHRSNRRSATSGTPCQQHATPSAAAEPLTVLARSVESLRPAGAPPA